jgi:hypothetical protein
LAVGAASLLVLGGVSLLLTGQLEDGRTLRQAAAGELEASGQPDLEFSAAAVEREAAEESPELEGAVGTARPSPPPVSAPSSEPATATGQRLRGGREKPAVVVDDLGLARREVAEQVRAFDRRRTEFESETAGCRELADAYRALDRAFVRFSTLLAQAGRRPSEADGRLFEIVDQESAAFDRSGCPRPS